MLVSIIIFFIVLSLLVLIHEFGHLITARKAGVPVLEFGFGLPPRIWGKKVGNTIYSINAIPFGGFVRLFGENGEEETELLNKIYGGRASSKVIASKAFVNKPKKVRAAIIVAGVVMNFLLGIAAFAIVYSFSGIPRETGEVRVVDISAASPAQTGGILVGDVIKKVDGQEIKEVSDFVKYVDTKKGKRVVFEVVRSVDGSDTIVKLTTTPRETPPEGEGPLGVVITTTEIYYPPAWQRPFYGIYYGFKEALFWGKTVFLGLVNIVLEAFKGHAPQDVSGPVGIFAVTTEAAKSGMLTLINFVGILSVNLAILNILPFPALDGGRLLFIGIESVVGRKVLPKVEATIHTIGMLILLALLLAVTIGDIRKLIAAGGIDGFLQSITK